MDNQFTSSAYFQYLNEKKLMGSRDVHSHEVFLPPRPVNPLTYSTDMEWVELKGDGILMAFTIVYIAPTAMINAGYDRKNPYCTGIVRMSEGPMISAQILGVDVSNPESIKIGMLLKVTYITRGAGEAQRVFLAFEPAV